MGCNADITATSHHAPPGLLRRQDNPDMRMMLCTAGHVDHGKTQLVGLLTGCATDRLKEERERGLTIDLGFAPCLLGDGMAVGIVDVPGHEKFVKNMVAGVSGIDMAILVVAADDGVMPQTIEHLQIMALLGVEHGIVALTKIDLVAPERIEEVRGGVRNLLRGTFMDNASICPLSSHTFEGIGEFYDTLKAQIGLLARQKKEGIFRMPVERTFVQKGFGNVVTGIPVAGTIRVGQQVELVPGGTIGRVRGIQRFQRHADSGGCGQCLALNIPEFSKSGADRGQVLCEPGFLDAVSMLHVQMETVATLDPPLRNAESVKVHTGAVESNATVYLLESSPLTAGCQGLATLVLHHPVAAAAHDRFILRRPSPASTVAGGEILEVQTDPVRPRKKALVQRLDTYRAWMTGVPRRGPAFERKRVQHLLKETLPHGTTAPDAARRLLLLVDVTREYLDALVVEKVGVELEPGFYIDSANLEAFLRQADAHAATLEKGKTLTLAVAQFQQGLGWPQPLWRRARQELQARGRIQVRDNTVLLRRAAGSLGENDQGLLDALVKLYDKTGFQSPRPEELPELVKASPQTIHKLLNVLYADQRLVRLSPSVVLSLDHFRHAQDLAVKAIQESGALDSADFKTHIGSSRKYALAILDYLDMRKVTVRSGNLRKLSVNYETRLL